MRSVYDVTLQKPGKAKYILLGVALFICLACGIALIYTFRAPDTIKAPDTIAEDVETNKTLHIQDQEPATEAM